MSSKRTTKFTKNIKPLNLTCGTVHEEAFLELQDTLRTAVQLSYPDPKKEFCVFTYVSERFWSVVGTQC